MLLSCGSAGLAPAPFVLRARANKRRQFAAQADRTAAPCVLNCPASPPSCSPLQVLESDGANVKALYRRAQAWLATADFVEAEQDIRAGLAEVRTTPCMARRVLWLGRWPAAPTQPCIL